MDRKKRNDIIMILILAAAAAGFLLYSRLSSAAASAVDIIVTVEDTEVFHKKSSELELPYTLEVEGAYEGHNVLVIDRGEDGTIGIQCVEADCPDKICMQTGHVVLADLPIVCLPHRMSARLQ